jgi:hypothetical protein
MNGYKRILYQAQRELERCQDRMKDAQRDLDGDELMRWTKHALHCEDIINYCEIKIEVNQ